MNSNFLLGLFILVLAGILVLLACSVSGCFTSPPPPAGLVTAKQFSPAHTDMVMIPIVVSNGTSTTTTLVPTFIYEPDRWELTVEPYDDRGNPLPVRRVLVNQGAYDAAKLGVWFQVVPEHLDTRQARKERK